MSVELPEVARMTPEERAQAQQQTAIDREHLIQWLHASQKEWLVLNSEHFVRSLTDEDVNRFIHMITSYRIFRSTIPASRTEIQKGPDGRPLEVQCHMGEQLELEEVNAAIRHLCLIARELDPDWQFSGN